VGVPDVVMDGTTLVSATTEDGYTVTADQFATGTTSAPDGWNEENPPEMADNLDLATATSNGYPLTTVDFGGHNWVDTNGDLPDFFLFESGGNDNGDIQAIFPDDSLGQPLRFTTGDWAPTGVPGLWAGQTIHGLAFAVTDLLDADGNPLTNSTVIKGLKFTNTGVDPTTIAAVAGPPVVQAFGPTPADGTIGVVTALFQWKAGDDAILHNVYLGTTPELTDADLQATHHPVTMFFYGPSLTPGTTYYWRVDEVEADGVTVHTGNVWSFMSQALTAYYPSPKDGETDVSPAPTLEWMPGQGIVEHHLYFGDDLDAVTQGSAEADKGVIERETTTSTPEALASLKTYYWRVDETAVANEVRTGAVWSFTTYLAVDDFEDYTDDEGSRIYETWIDGWINDTGSQVGYIEAPFAEQDIVRTGAQSMPVDYNNMNEPYYSEAMREFSPAQDWTISGADTVVLSVRGRPGNGAAQLYMAAEDTAGHTAVVVCPDQAALTTARWTDWKVPLADFVGVDVTRIEKMYIGTGDRNAQTPGGAGLLYVDDIRLIRSSGSN